MHRMSSMSSLAACRFASMNRIIKELNRLIIHTNAKDQYNYCFHKWSLSTIISAQQHIRLVFNQFKSDETEDERPIQYIQNSKPQYWHRLNEVRVDSHVAAETLLKEYKI